MPVITPNPITVIPAKTSGGSVKNPANLIAYSAASQGPQAELWANVVKSLRDLQSQVDGVANSLRAPLGLPDPIQVVDTAGNLVAVIGQILDPANNASSIGLWTQSQTSGGTGPSTASVTLSGSTAPLVVSGVGTAISSNFNIDALARFSDGGVNVNSGVVFNTGATGTTAFRGFYISKNSQDLFISRFDSAGTANPAQDVTILSNGNIGLGLNNSSPTHTLDLNVDSAAKPTTNTWTISSDGRTKRNIRPLEGGMSVINNLRPVESEYNGLAGTPEGQRVVSVIAQDAKEHLPHSVTSSKRKLNPDDVEDSEILGFNSHEMIFHMLLGLQQIDARLIAKGI